MAEPERRGRTLSDVVTMRGFRLGALAARALPGLAAAALATPIGFGASTTNRDRRAMVERHLRRANPTLEGLALRRAVQEAFDSYARYWIESFRLPNLHRQVVEAGFKVSGFEHVDDGLDKGNGVILALPHLGGWEWAGRWLALRGVKITVVVERLDPPELFDWFVDLRSELGMTVIALGPDAGKAVLGALKRNEVVCLLSDRDLDGRGVEVEFFGERTTLPAGPATLGIRTGAPILPTAVYFTPRYNGHFGLVRPALDTTRSGSLRDDVARVTQQLASELELLITRAPEQWHLLQPNWPSDPGYGENRA
jgi:KDO2-lipid IV(A) lauroyltransferase